MWRITKPTTGEKETIRKSFEPDEHCTTVAQIDMGVSDSMMLDDQNSAQNKYFVNLSSPDEHNSSVS